MALSFPVSPQLLMCLCEATDAQTGEVLEVFYDNIVTSNIKTIDALLSCLLLDQNTHQRLKGKVIHYVGFTQ